MEERNKVGGGREGRKGSEGEREKRKEEREQWGVAKQLSLLFSSPPSSHSFILVVSFLVFHSQICFFCSPLSLFLYSDKFLLCFPFHSYSDNLLSYVGGRRDRGSFLPCSHSLFPFTYSHSSFSFLVFCFYSSIYHLSSKAKKERGEVFREREEKLYWSCLYYGIVYSQYQCWACPHYRLDYSQSLEYVCIPNTGDAYSNACCNSVVNEQTNQTF